MAKLSTILTGMRNHEPDAFVLAQDRLDNPKVCAGNKTKIRDTWNEVWAEYTGETTPEIAVAQASQEQSPQEVVAGLERLAREMAKARLEKAVAAAGEGNRVRTRIRLGRNLDDWTDQAFEEIVSALQAA